MQKLKCGCQKYAWGKPGSRSKVAELVGQSVDAPNERFAELWIGTHPSMPASIEGVPLKHVLTNQAEQFMGATLSRHSARWGTDVPFLLKVLSIDTALSVQAHPDLARAKVLHAKDPKHYPDPNHKPELVVALTPYEALCCFRPLEEFAEFLRTIPPLKRLIANADDIISHNRNGSARQLLQKALESLYATPDEIVTAAIYEHLAAIRGMPSDNKKYEHVVFERVSGQYPGDVGSWMIYILNLVKLNPGDGLFLGPNEPHSYLAGDSVEIMAASDNVVRAGLTPKFKDVPTLLEMLTYRTDSLNEAKFNNNGEAVQYYSPPSFIEEFKLVAVRLSKEQPRAKVQLTSVALGVVVSGRGVVAGSPVIQGDTFVLPFTPQVEVEGDGLTVFLAMTNAPAQSNL